MYYYTHIVLHIKGITTGPTLLGRPEWGNSPARDPNRRLATRGREKN